MKKLLTITVASLVFFLATPFSGFSQVYQKGDKLLNAGIGLGTYGYGGLGFGGSLEFGVTDAISVGPLVGYSSTSEGYLGLGNYKFSTLTIGARGSYHLSDLLKINSDKIDLYAGLGLGYHNFHSNYSGYSGSYGSGITFLAHLGGRYYLSDNIGIFAELGSGFSTLHAGVAFKF